MMQKLAFFVFIAGCFVFVNPTVLLGESILIDLDVRIAEELNQNLPADKILIGGYTFDEKPGFESFSFYYTAKPYSSLEDMVKKAQNIGEDMPRMKGVLTDSISTFNADVVMTDPAFYHNALTLRFEHK